MGTVWGICPLVSFSAVARTFTLFVAQCRACAGQTAIGSRMASEIDVIVKTIFPNQ
jgi:hypothetical protein